MEELFVFLDPIWEELSIFLIGMGTGISILNVVEEKDKNRRSKYIRPLVIVALIVLAVVLLWI